MIRCEGLEDGVMCVVYEYRRDCNQYAENKMARAIKAHPSFKAYEYEQKPAIGKKALKLILDASDLSIIRLLDMAMWEKLSIEQAFSR